MADYKLRTPAGYVPLQGMGYEAADTTVHPVSPGRPLPVAVHPRSDPPPALAGETSVDLLVGPFSPTTALPVLLVLTGEWQGSATLLRSTDGGATLIPLTLAGMEWGRFTGNACEPVWEENASSAVLYLSIAISSGMMAYRLGH